MKSTRTNNDGVIDCWTKGQPAHGGSRKTLTTDGESLFSYNLKIGARTKSGMCIVADYTGGTNSFKSQTTSCHVGLAKRVADLVMHPKVWEISPLSDDDDYGEILF